MTRKKPNAVSKACEKAGSQRALSLSLGVTEQAVCVWVKQGWVPLRRAQEIETLYGIPRSQTMNPRVRELVSSGADV